MLAKARGAVDAIKQERFFGGHGKADDVFLKTEESKRPRVVSPTKPVVQQDHCEQPRQTAADAANGVGVDQPPNHRASGPAAMLCESKPAASREQPCEDM